MPLQKSRGSFRCCLVMVALPAMLIVFYLLVLKMDTRIAAGKLERKLDSLKLPAGTVVSMRGILSGNLLAGTGSNFDVGAYIALVLPDTDAATIQSLAGQVSILQGEMDSDGDCKMFEITTPLSPYSIEQGVKDEIALAPRGKPVYVIYVMEWHAQDNFWDLRTY